jgi:hypothetical protein
MVFRARDLDGVRLAAMDGANGRVVDCLFDDGEWTVRHLVVDTGGWLPGRRALVSPACVRDVDLASRRVVVVLSRKQVDESPDRSTGHLHSTRDIIGYEVDGRDGAVGHVDELLIDDESWTIRWLVVDTGTRMPGRKILVSPESIQEVAWARRGVRGDFGLQQVRAAPDYHPEEPAHDDYDRRLLERSRRPVDRPQAA